MFGKIRASPSQESELQSSKLLKQDSFSIYECTLLKLKLGSQQKTLEISLDNAGSSPDSFPTCMDINDSTPRCFVNFREDFNPGEADSPSPVSSERPKTTTYSVPYLFSKYKSSHRHFSADETSKPDS